MRFLFYKFQSDGCEDDGAGQRILSLSSWETIQKSNAEQKREQGAHPHGGSRLGRKGGSNEMLQMPH